jgi:ATP-dependent Lhr-like helicase
MVERVTRHLSERIGAENIAAHHGSLAKELRLDAEQRLKAGSLRALVATASLELGIDIGDVDLVCQLGTPRSIGRWCSASAAPITRSAACPRVACFR